MKGEEFRRALRKAISAQHKAARNKRGKRPTGMQRADFGAKGYRREPPSSYCQNDNKDSGTVEGLAGAAPQVSAPTHPR